MKCLPLCSQIKLFDYDHILRWLEHNPQLTRTSDDAPRNTALDGLDTGVMRHPGNRGGLNDDGTHDDHRRHGSRQFLEDPLARESSECCSS